MRRYIEVKDIYILNEILYIHSILLCHSNDYHSPSQIQGTLESNISDLQDELHSKTSELNRLQTEMKLALNEKATLKQVATQNIISWFNDVKKCVCDCKINEVVF